jgi:5S rRNA maturation endonuclease (ribonuclease M5)
MSSTHQTSANLVPQWDSIVDRVSILQVYEMTTGLRFGTFPWGNGRYVVRCPVKEHEDVHPSCILNEQTGRWFCFSCKSKGGKLQLVVAAQIAPDLAAAAIFLESRIGRRLTLIDQPPMKPNQVRGATEKLEDEKLVGRYPYHDENGVLLYEALRFEGKSVMGGRDKRFVLRAPDGANGWTHKLTGIRRVPYRLPQLLAAAKGSIKQSVIVVEGENKVDALTELKFVATTNAQGWGWDWPLSWAKYFLGHRQVLLLSDADGPGRKASAAHDTLLRNSGISVVTIDLYPDRNDGSDIVDWLKDHRTPRQTRLQLRNALIEKLSGYCDANR